MNEEQQCNFLSLGNDNNNTIIAIQQEDNITLWMQKK